MTVCIAAIYNDSAILGASDRMVTGGFGDITFEPHSPKIIDVTNSIAVMTAGDQNIQMQVYEEVRGIVKGKIDANPNQWLDVLEVAELYSKAFYKLRNKLIENNVLSQYNLTLDQFIAKQNQMSKEFVDMVSNRIDRFTLYDMQNRSIETIIAGIDDSGPHIYVMVNGEISCNDKLGFAAIGIGRNHAISHFMLSRYSRNDSEPKALLTIHQAKKKSEVSPGVGKETDMCVIAVKGRFARINEENFKKPIVKDLDQFYKSYRHRIEQLDKKTEVKIKDYLSSLQSTTQPQQEASPAPSTTVAPLSPPKKTSDKAKTKKRKQSR